MRNSHQATKPNIVHKNGRPPIIRQEQLARHQHLKTLIDECKQLDEAIKPPQSTSLISQKQLTRYRQLKALARQCVALERQLKAALQAGALVEPGLLTVQSVANVPFIGQRRRKADSSV